MYVEADYKHEELRGLSATAELLVETQCIESTYMLKMFSFGTNTHTDVCATRCLILLRRSSRFALKPRQTSSIRCFNSSAS